MPGVVNVIGKEDGYDPEDRADTSDLSRGGEGAVPGRSGLGEDARNHRRTEKPRGKEAGSSPGSIGDIYRQRDRRPLGHRPGAHLRLRRKGPVPSEGLQT